jgi:diguanylate cyclase (GGDEF)-like protein
MKHTKTKTTVEVIQLMKYMFIYIITFYMFIYIWRDDPYIKMMGSNFFSVLGSAIATVCLYHAYKKAIGSERLFWCFINLSCLSYFIATVSWSYYNIVLKVNVPFPGLPDIFYLLQPVFILLAILYLIFKNKSIFFSIQLFLDILITMTVVTSLSWYYLIQPIFAKEVATYLFKAVSAAYPIADLGLVFGILRLSIILNNFFYRFQYIFLIIGLILFTIADSLFLYLNSNQSYQTGSFIDPLWILGYFFIAVAGVYNNYQNTKPQQSGINLNRDSNSLLLTNFKDIVLPYISLFVLLIVLSIRIKKIDSIILGSILGIVLLTIRQIFNLLDNKQLFSLLSQSRQSSNSMKLEARTDFLTGLYNRRYIIERLEMLLEQARLHKLVFSLFMIDIDHFKQINDTFGHEAGDVVLQEIAQIMTKNIRFEEVIGRFGGEEFIAIVPEVGLVEAEIIADRLRKQIDTHIFTIGPQNIKITVSIGVSQWSTKNNDDIQSLIARIDKALYMAKEKGRNCTVVL